MTGPTSPRRGCSPWTLMGCGCGLLAMIGIALIFVVLGIFSMRERVDPTWNMRAYGTCQNHLRALRRAVASYQMDHHKLPEKLTDLEKHYLSSEKSLHCPLEASGGALYRYTPAPAGANTPLITCDNHGQGTMALLHNGKLRLPDDALRGGKWQRSRPIPHKGERP